MFTQDTHSKLQALGCNPLKLSAQIANGTGITMQHPQFKAIQSSWKKLLISLQKGDINITLLQSFWNEVSQALQYSAPSQDIRSKHILSLTKFVAPVLSSVEQTNLVADMENVDSIPDEVLEAIANGEIDVE